MGLFGKKKTPAEILDEAGQLYRAGRYTDGHAEAAKLYAERFGEGSALPNEEAVPAQEPEPVQETAPAQEAKPVQKAVTAQEPGAEAERAYQKGEELRRAKDYDGAFRAYTQAAEVGHEEALKKLVGLYAGSRFVWGLGAQKKEAREKYTDYDKAIEWGNLAIKRGVDVADTVMDAYKGKGQPEEALVFGEKAAAQGLDTEWKLMYLCIELERYDEAVAWGEKHDAKKGTDEAKQRLAQLSGEAFDKGMTAYMEEDYPQARSLWAKSAGLGDAAAAIYCGLMDEGGQDAGAPFIPLDLNEGNVRAIFKRCLAKDYKGDYKGDYLSSVLFPPQFGYTDFSKRQCYDFDRKTILANEANIQYLFGQLQATHINKKILTIEDFFKNYSNKNWATSKSSILELLYLGNCAEIDLIQPFNAKKGDITSFNGIIKPTLSPKDPNFPAWWEAHKSEWETPAPTAQ